MRHILMSKDFQNERLTNNLRERISKIGRWHSRRRKADSTRIWKILYSNIEKLLKDEKHPFTSNAYIMLTVYPDNLRYSMQVHKHNSTLYYRVIGKSQKDCNKVIQTLNEILAHYNLVLIETVESRKRNSYHFLNSCKEYELKFAKTIE